MQFGTSSFFFNNPGDDNTIEGVEKVDHLKTGILRKLTKIEGSVI